MATYLYKCYSFRNLQINSNSIECQYPRKVVNFIDPLRYDSFQDVETLLSKQKLNINQIYGERTLISLAAFHGKRRMTQMLLRYNPDVNQIIDKVTVTLLV